MGVGVAIMADEEGVGTLGISSMRIISLTLFRLGGGGLFDPPPLRQNRDNCYTERALTFKFSDFS